MEPHVSSHPVSVFLLFSFFFSWLEYSIGSESIWVCSANPFTHTLEVQDAKDIAYLLGCAEPSALEHKL